MARYFVTTEETVVRTYQVSADSAADARQSVSNGDWLEIVEDELLGDGRTFVTVERG